MYLLNSWRESLLFLKPKNFKLLLLVTLRTIRDSYKLFLPLLFLFVILQLSLWDFIFLIETRYLFFGIKSSLFVLVKKILLLNLFFIFGLIARPSVKRKTVGYFCDYVRHFIYWFFVTLLVVLFFEFYLRIMLLPVISFVRIVPLEVFLILFWLDSRASFKNLFLSLLRAAKMFIFNVPFLIIVLVTLFWGLHFFEMVRDVLIRYSLQIALFTFYICLFTNFYTKRLHDQFTLYFKE